MRSCVSAALISILVAMVASAQAAESEELRVMTFNIRYGTAADGENDWLHRKEQVFNVIREYQPHVLGVQEAVATQLEQLAAEFPQLVALGVGREPDGTGEYSALLFDRHRLDCLRSGTFWLSETPEKRGSRSWGNQLPRICCWGEFVDRATKTTFRVYNTHWDHESQAARVGSGQLIADRMGIIAQQMPAVLMGDFNVGSDDLARAPLAEIGLRDTYFLANNAESDTGTFNSFRGERSGPKIDTIYTNDRFETVSAAIDHTARAGRFPSDHFPVTATLRFVEP